LRNALTHRHFLRHQPAAELFLPNLNNSCENLYGLRTSLFFIGYDRWLTAAVLLIQ
jgi:hypothetical protein